MAAPKLQHNHSFTFQQSSPLDTLVRRSSSRRTNVRPAATRSLNHSGQDTYPMSPYIPNVPIDSPPRQQRPNNQLAPQSPLLHTQFRGSTISTNTNPDNSFLDQSMSDMAGDQSHQAEYGMYPDTTGVNPTSSGHPSHRQVSSPKLDPENTEQWEDAYAGMSSQIQPAGTLPFQVDGDDGSLPTVVISPADYEVHSPVLQPTRGGKAPIAAPPRFNFSRPGRPPALPPDDHKRAVIERNLGRHQPVAGATGPSSSMPDLLSNSQPLAYHSGLSSSSRSYRDVAPSTSNTHPSIPLSSVATDMPLLQSSSRGRDVFGQPAPKQPEPIQPLKPIMPIAPGAIRGPGYPHALNSYGRPSNTTTPLIKPPTLDSMPRPDSAAQYSIRSISIYSNMSSAEPSPSAGQLFGNESRSMPFKDLSHATTVTQSGWEGRANVRGEGAHSHPELTLPNPHIQNVSAGPPTSVLNEQQGRHAYPEPLSSRSPSSTTSWQSGEHNNIPAGQKQLPPPSAQSPHSGFPASLSSGVALATSYLAQNPSSESSSASLVHQNSSGNMVTSGHLHQYDQAPYASSSSTAQQRSPAGQPAWASTPDLTNSHRSTSKSSMRSHDKPGGKASPQSFSDRSPTSPTEPPLPSTAVREHVQLPRGPPSRAVSPAGSVYSQYSFYQLDGSSRSSPTGSTPQLSSQSAGFQPLPLGEARPTLLSPTYTPPTRPPGAVRFESNPAISEQESQTAHDFLQLGIQHHENNRLRDAAWCFERSAKEGGGCGVGMVMWGLSLRHGWGCEKNELLGFKWLQKAAESAVKDLENTKKDGGDKHRVQNELVIAIYEVGQCFFQGWGVRKDLKMAVSYYTVAAKMGDADAQHDLGFCLANGKGCKKDRKEAAKWHRAAIAQGASDVGMAWVYKEKFQ